MGDFDMKEIINKSKNILRNISGVFFIFIGFFGMIYSSFWAGLFMLMFVISLLPIFYVKTKLNLKHIQVFLPIFLIFLSIFAMPSPTKETSNNNTEENTINDINEIQENPKIEITKLYFTESNIELDVNETKDILLEIEPTNADISSLEFCTSDNKVATIENHNLENLENKIAVKINPISEGTCEVYVKTANNIESNKVTIKIIDNERIEQEKIAKEEQQQKEAEEQAKKVAEEQAKQKAKEVNTNSTSKQSSTSSKSSKKKSTSSSSSRTTTNNAKKSSSSSSSNSNNTHGKVIYRTPYGKKYHFDPDCGGKNSYQITLDAAKSSGLTPCQKCAQ